MINVVIVDDDKDSADSLGRNINGVDEISVNNIFYNGYDLISYCEENTPDIILMDINMPEISGIETSRIIKERKPEIKIIFLTVYMDKEYIIKSMEFKCEGFILKGQSSDSMVKIIKNTHCGFNTYDKNITEIIKNEFIKVPEKPDSVSILTRREESILKLVVFGKSDAQIAKELSISEGYLRNTLVKLRNKVGVKNSKELAVWGIKNGF